MKKKRKYKKWVRVTLNVLGYSAFIACGLVMDCIVIYGLFMGWM